MQQGLIIKELTIVRMKKDRTIQLKLILSQHIVIVIQIKLV